MIKISSIFLVLGFVIFPSSSYAQNVDDAQICRAGIATVMNKDFAEVEFYREVKQVKYISFAPTEDNQIFKFKCHIDGKRIHWATEMGNWRDSGLDSVVEYTIKDKFFIVHERHTNGSVFNKRFNLQDLINKKK